MKNAIGSELLARWRFFLLLGILIFPMQCAFGSKGFASIPFALIVSGRRSIHTAIISTDA